MAQVQTAARPHKRRRHAFLGGTSGQWDLRGGLLKTEPKPSATNPVSLQLRDHVLERVCVRPMGTPRYPQARPPNPS